MGFSMPALGAPYESLGIKKVNQQLMLCVANALSTEKFSLLNLSDNLLCL